MSAIIECKMGTQSVLLILQNYLRIIIYGELTMIEIPIVSHVEETETHRMRVVKKFACKLKKVLFVVEQTISISGMELVRIYFHYAR